MPRVDVRNLHIHFPLYHVENRLIKRCLREGRTASENGNFETCLGQDTRHRTTVDVLQGVSFTVLSGERVGLIGSNGAGKTTLLRALAGIYEPVLGTVRLAGTVGALLDPTLGMNPEFTGRENTRIFALQNGLNSQDIKQFYHNIEEFSELESYFDLPTKMYSAGMNIRLAFGMATALVPQILLMDEWFLAGDGLFIQKAEQRLLRMVEKAKILIVSSHQPDILQKWCDRILWLDGGRIREDGEAQAVLKKYHEQ